MERCPGHNKDGRTKRNRTWIGAVLYLGGTALASLFIVAGVMCMPDSMTVSATASSTGASASSSSASSSSATASSSTTSASVAAANTAILNSIKDKQDQISAAEDERDKLKNNLSDLQKMKKDLENQKDNLQAYVKQLDSNLEVIEAKIADLNQQIDAKEAEIAQAEAELKDAIQKEDDQKELITKSIRLMYETGGSYMVDMLLQSSSYRDFLNRVDFMESVMDYENIMLDQLVEIREYVELCKRQLDLEKEILDRTKENVETEEKNLEELIDQKKKDITAYQSDINNKEKAIREYEASIAQRNAEIKALEDAVAEERRQILENNGTLLTYDGGVFKFPLASYTRISSDYGDRSDPILGITKFHSGVDFAAPKGTAIYAAYDGKVVAATYSTSMGNYVMINHGDNLYTIYMHASALYVSKGDTVVKGDTIAAVGTTGRSTGNHLHFSVRKDGSYVSPWNYLSR